MPRLNRSGFGYLIPAEIQRVQYPSAANEAPDQLPETAIGHQIRSDVQIRQRVVGLAHVREEIST